MNPVTEKTLGGPKPIDAYLRMLRERRTATHGSLVTNGDGVIIAATLHDAILGTLEYVWKGNGYSATNATRAKLKKGEA